MIGKALGLTVALGYTIGVVNTGDVHGMLSESTQKSRPSIENVQNPFKLLMDSIDADPTRLKGEICSAVIDKVRSIENKSAPLLENIKSVDNELAEEWTQNIRLLATLFNGIRDGSDVDVEYKKLVAVTDDGFAIRTQEAIFEFKDTEKNVSILDEFLQILWQGREIAEYFRLISMNEISVDNIPQLFENMEHDLIAIEQVTRELDINTSKLSLLKCTVCKILGAYQYTEFGKVINNPNNQKFLCESLEQYKNSELIDVLLKPFGNGSL